MMLATQTVESFSTGSITTLLVGGGTLIVGVYVWVSCHIANRRRHPSADNIVYKATCEEVQKRMDEREERATERHEELKELIISNGKSGK